MLYDSYAVYHMRTRSGRFDPRGSLYGYCRSSGYIFYAFQYLPHLRNAVQVLYEINNASSCPMPKVIPEVALQVHLERWSAFIRA